MGTNFLGSPNLMDFAVFSHAMGNWWGNPRISHIIKSTTEFESNGKKTPILWENYEYQFPRLSTYDGFCRIFPEINFSGFSHSIGLRLASISHVLGNWQENPCISHMMKYTIGWDSNEKKHPYYGKSMTTNFPGFRRTMGFLGYYQKSIFQTFPTPHGFGSLFPCYGKLVRKHVFPMWWNMS